MQANRIKLDHLARLLWGAALLTLPVTSFRYFPFLGEDTLVRPLALYPLVLLAPILVIRLLHKKIAAPWPGSLIPLGGFLLSALLVTIVGALLMPLELRGNTYWERTLRAWVTLAVGLYFFLSAVWMNQNEADLRFSAKWLYSGLFLSIVWSGVQVLAFYTDIIDKHALTLWQRAFSMRELVRTERVSGLAYEPAWLAGQIATLYMPWLFATILTRYRVSRYKWLEPVLLALTLLLLFLTYSRGGIFVTVVAVGLTFLLAGRETMKRIWQWIRAPFHQANQSTAVRLQAWGIRIGTLLVIASLLVIAFFFLSQKGYFRQLWSSTASSLEEYIIDNYAGARIAYAWGAMEAFQAHPWTGVGLGASGFYIYQNLPDWALTTVPEIARQISPDNRLYPNPKNLYIRLLAETGLPGFALFLIFQLSILGSILPALHSQSNVNRFTGVSGLFSWIAIVLYCFTQDTLATPNLWINLGILVGMSSLWLKAKTSTKSRDVDRKRKQ